MAIKYSRKLIIFLHRTETLITIPIKRGVQTELCLPVRTPRSRFLVNRKEINMSKTVVSSDNAPAAIGPYSPGIQTGNMVFLSGQLGIDPTTGKMPEGVEAQAKQSLANVEALLTAAGATFADVVKTTVYLADIADFAAVNEIYASKFEAPFPARSAFQVAALPAGGLVEIEVVAAL